MGNKVQISVWSCCPRLSCALRAPLQGGRALCGDGTSLPHGLWGVRQGAPVQGHLGLLRCRGRRVLHPRWQPAGLQAVLSHHHHPPLCPTILSLIHPYILRPPSTYLSHPQSILPILSYNNLPIHPPTTLLQSIQPLSTYPSIWSQATKRTFAIFICWNPLRRVLHSWK